MAEHFETHLLMDRRQTSSEWSSGGGGREKRAIQLHLIISALPAVLNVPTTLRNSDAMQAFFVPAYVAIGIPGLADSVTGAAGQRAILMQEEAVPCAHWWVEGGRTGGCCQDCAQGRVL